MIRVLAGIFIALHGLVHLWYVVLSQRLVEFQADMGWTGESWLLTRLLGDTGTRSVAAVVFGLAAVGFSAGGVGMLLRQGWSRPVLIASAAFSALMVTVFWDGRPGMIVQKGLVGLLIDGAILMALLVLG